MYENLFSLEGRVALITGASRGIGQGVARGLAEAGADVVMTARSEKDLKLAANEIRGAVTGAVGVKIISTSLNIRSTVRFQRAL